MAMLDQAEDGPGRLLDQIGLIWANRVREGIPYPHSQHLGLKCPSFYVIYIKTARHNVMAFCSFKYECELLIINMNRLRLAEGICRMPNAARLILGLILLTLTCDVGELGIGRSIIISIKGSICLMNSH